MYAMGQEGEHSEGGRREGREGSVGAVARGGPSMGRSEAYLEADGSAAAGCLGSEVSARMGRRVHIHGRCVAHCECMGTAEAEAGAGGACGKLVGCCAPDPSETGTGEAPPGSADHEDVPGMLGDVACGGETAETEADVAGERKEKGWEKDGAVGMESMG